MRVVAGRGAALALCADEAGAEVDVMTDLVGPVAPGDGLLVHAGVALARLA
jgi:hydrogenase maturation factor